MMQPNVNTKKNKKTTTNVLETGFPLLLSDRTFSMYIYYINILVFHLTVVGWLTD